MTSLAERWMSRRSISSKNSRNSNASGEQDGSAAVDSSKISGNSSSNTPELKLKIAQLTEVSDAGLLRNDIRADHLYPIEVDRFCAAHLQIQGGQCSYLGGLDGCLVWEAKNKMWTIDRFPVDLARYLDSSRYGNGEAA